MQRGLISPGAAAAMQDVVAMLMEHDESLAPGSGGDDKCDDDLPINDGVPACPLATPSGSGGASSASSSSMLRWDHLKVLERGNRTRSELVVIPMLRCYCQEIQTVSSHIHNKSFDSPSTDQLQQDERATAWLHTQHRATWPQGDVQAAPQLQLLAHETINPCYCRSGLGEVARA